MTVYRDMTPSETESHNEEARAVWEAYRAGDPIRPPVILETDTRFFILDDDFNTRQAVSFESYSHDASTMMDFQLRAAAWRGSHIAPFCDDFVGVPESFTVKVDMQRYFDAAHFGAEIEYLPGQTPDTKPLLEGDRKNLLFDLGLPDPLTGGAFAHAHRLYADMVERIDSGFLYEGVPVDIAPFGVATDGPLTVATNLRGVELYTDLYTDPEYVHRLLDFIVEGTIARIKAHRDFFGLPERSETWFYADDAVQMISTEMVGEFVVPVHHALNDALTKADRVAMHLCGDASRHFKFLRDELGVYSFDTGFPIDFSQLRDEVGPEVEILGGPRVPLLLHGSPAEVSAETERILKSGIQKGGRFILREANDLAPRTPVENMEAMYETARRVGRYS